MIEGSPWLSGRPREALDRDDQVVGHSSHAQLRSRSITLGERQFVGRWFPVFAGTGTIDGG